MVDIGNKGGYGCDLGGKFKCTVSMWCVKIAKLLWPFAGKVTLKSLGHIDLQSRPRALIHPEAERITADPHTHTAGTLRWHDCRATQDGRPNYLTRLHPVEFNQLRVKHHHRSVFPFLTVSVCICACVCVHVCVANIPLPCVEVIKHKNTKKYILSFFY